eukprot:SAG31_NODE_181_length_21114_cov_99.705211_21_plen_107_part_00
MGKATKRPVATVERKSARKRSKVGTYNDDAAYTAMESKAAATGGKSAKEELQGKPSYRDSVKAPPTNVHLLPGRMPLPTRKTSGQLCFPDYPVHMLMHKAYGLNEV